MHKIIVIYHKCLRYLNIAYIIIAVTIILWYIVLSYFIVSLSQTTSKNNAKRNRLTSYCQHFSVNTSTVHMSSTVKVKLTYGQPLHSPLIGQNKCKNELQKGNCMSVSVQISSSVSASLIILIHMIINDIWHRLRGERGGNPETSQHQQSILMFFYR